MPLWQSDGLGPPIPSCPVIEAVAGNSLRLGFAQRIPLRNDVAADIKVIASFPNVSMANDVSDNLGPIVKSRLEALMRQRLAESENPKPPGESGPVEGAN